MKFILKLLNKLGVLKYFRFTANLSILKKTIKVPIINGLGLHNLNQKNTWFTQMLERFYSQYPHHVFLDIGANIGQTFIQVLAAAPKWTYIGFEPNTNCVTYIEELINANQKKQSTIYPFAISNTTGTLNLYYNTNADTTATTLNAFRPNVYKDGYTKEIQAVKFDEFFKNKLTDNASYIVKIDIEGAEYHALQGMQEFIQKKRPLIICEVLDTHAEDTLETHQLHLKNMKTLLHNTNYEIYQIIRTKEDLNIHAFNHIKTFETKVWSPESLQLNDYLFMPKENKLNLNSLFNLD
ncbi:FkbM family methyltransferase [Lacinutrix iliipiscaria]|uniref:FkbM family methyltransferase n=1 Tax=Lacinutrix iliipiscaria TaxID=1230532 RepID=A0ABW5WLE6_9FLAO